MQRKKARKAGGWGSEIKGWDTQKGGGIDYKGGGDHTPLHTVNPETNHFTTLTNIFYFFVFLFSNLKKKKITIKKVDGPPLSTDQKEIFTKV